MDIEKLKRLLRAVKASEWKGIYCEDVDNTNWFDLRDEILEEIEAGQSVG